MFRLEKDRLLRLLLVCDLFIIAIQNNNIDINIDLYRMARQSLIRLPDILTTAGNDENNPLLFNPNNKISFYGVYQMKKSEYFLVYPTPPLIYKSENEVNNYI